MFSPEYLGPKNVYIRSYLSEFSCTSKCIQISLTNMCGHCIWKQLGKHLELQNGIKGGCKLSGIYREAVQIQQLAILVVFGVWTKSIYSYFKLRCLALEVMLSLRPSFIVHRPFFSCLSNEIMDLTHQICLLDPTHLLTYLTILAYPSTYLPLLYTLVHQFSNRTANRLSDFY